MRGFVEKVERLLELGGVKKDVVLLVLGGAGVACSLAGVRPFSFDMAWIAIVLCGVPILLEAFIGLVTAFDIKADVLVSLALVASVAIGEDFAAGEVAFIMQLGALLEDLTVARARAGIEKLVRLTPRTARVLRDGAEMVVSRWWTPQRSKWGTSSGCCPGRRCRWTGWSAPGRPPSTRR